MATSESDDFESADEELEHHNPRNKRQQQQQQQQQRQRNFSSAIDSDSGDDTNYIPVDNTRRYFSSYDNPKKIRNTNTAVATGEQTSANAMEGESKLSEDSKSQVHAHEKVTEDVCQSKDRGINANSQVIDSCSKSEEKKEIESSEKQSVECQIANKSNKSHGQVAKNTKKSATKGNEGAEGASGFESKAQDGSNNEIGVQEKESEIDKKSQESVKDTEIQSTNQKPIETKANKGDNPEVRRAGGARKVNQQSQRKPKQVVKKLGEKVAKPPLLEATTPDEVRRKAIAEGKEPPLIQGCWEMEDDADFKDEKKEVLEKNENAEGWDEMEMPEELMSDKKFKEVFKPEGWEGVGNNIDLSEQLTAKHVLDKLSSGTKMEDSWGGWGGWGVSSLINTATAGVSTITSHVSHGLSLLEESMGVPDPDVLEAEQNQEREVEEVEKEEKPPEHDPEPSPIAPSSFGLSNFISGMSSITKLVESTGSKVIIGGLDTLETIGKKTMEVLQEGDPGLKKKRAFFMNESDKPILSQVLREAKAKADAEQKTLEEREMSRKIHFESLFDDYQGLVHLEALEMLSKQSNIKIQQHLTVINQDELNSVQETLEEVKELCDLGDEDEDEDNDNENFELKERLLDASKDLGIDLNYEKLHEAWEETKSYLLSSTSEREVFQEAISTLARFTALSVERFHKIAELLLIKERRSTVNEADALVHLTRILTNQIGTIAAKFSNWLNEFSKKDECNINSDAINANITTIFVEATNASSYIQDAFRLLIPILQVGAV